MPEQIKNVSPPTGISRILFRMPILLYRWGLGGLLGSRFLELTHTGRKSGLARKTVLEVVAHDAASRTYYVAVGFGKKSDWYQNVQANPHIEVRSGRDHFKGVAVPLTKDEAGDQLAIYARKYPMAFRELLKVMGFAVQDTPEDIHALGEFLPMFALKPD